MGFGGSAPEEKKPAVAQTPAAAVAAPAAPAGISGDVLAVIAAAIAAYEGEGANPVIGRLSSPGWTNYARVATVTIRDQMF